jgi:prepilin-type N-terminal cleavage/methylation domain-containing protein
MRIYCSRGFSLVETLTALALIASVSAALLPALVLASRLHRDSAIETEAAIIAAARLEDLAAALAAGGLAAGGRLDIADAGWHNVVDRAGAPVARAQASYEVRWAVTPLGGSSRVHVLAVRVVPLANPFAAITLTTAVGDE